MEKLKLNYINDVLIEVYYTNNKKIGNFVMLEDGYYYYEPLKNSGVFSTFTLDLISKELKEINEVWGEHIKKDLDKSN